MEVIGAGFGRTGTLSLKKALEILGFGPCYHMQVAMLRPRHWLFWHRVSRGLRPGWKHFFRHYRAAVDWPASRFYLELAEEYPEAKIVLTVRDPEQWYDSTFRTIYAMKKYFPWWLPNLVTGMQNRIIWNGIFKGNFKDRKESIRIFEDHIRRVKESFSPERLLVFDVSEGWEPLCRFLGVNVPEDTPFPRLNDTRKYRRWIALVVVADFLFYLFLLLWGFLVFILV